MEDGVPGIAGLNVQHRVEILEKGSECEHVIIHGLNTEEQHALEICLIEAHATESLARYHPLMGTGLLGTAGLRAHQNVSDQELGIVIIHSHKMAGGFVKENR